MTPEWEPRVKSLEDTLQSFMKSQAQFNERLFEKIDDSERAFSNKIDAISRPNYTVVIALVGLIVAIGGACLTASVSPIKNDITHLYLEQEKMDQRDARNYEKLDERLQREFQLALETQKQGLDHLNTTSKERHDEVADSIKRVQTEFDNVTEWKDGQLRDDLNELRVRRYHKELNFEGNNVTKPTKE